MRNFRLAGTCIFLSLIVGCAGTATEGMRENNKITKGGFARLKTDAAKTKPQYQCPPPGLPSPDALCLPSECYSGKRTGVLAKLLTR